MKKIIVILIVLFYNSSTIYSQIIVEGFNQINDVEIPQERIFIHYNSSLLLSGENLLFKIYCLNTDTKKLSNLSKVVYVELVGVNKKPFFKQKIKLESGKGQGDFFIPSNISSGNYKLIAYTQWMRNGGVKDFFQADINIINPFLENQGKMESENNIDEILTFNKKNISNSFIELETNNKIFSSRDKVILKVSSKLNNQSFGNYSISVRKIDTVKIPNRLTTINFAPRIKSNSNQKNQLIYLPELRGELISGKIISNNKKGISNKKVALSILGKHSIFKMANTNDLGVFHFNIDNEYSNSEAIVQVFNHLKEDYTISLQQKPSIDYSNLIFNDLIITSKLKNYILERSIHNQIENAYDSIKSNTIIDLKPISPFHHTINALEYVLDDYTRFPTIKETFVEIIDKAWLTKEKDNYSFRIRGNEAENISPIVLVDGVLIQNHNEIVDFSAKKIKKITVIQDKYLYGSQKFGGIVSIETINNDFKNNTSKDYVTLINLFTPERNKDYFNQTYTNDKKSDRIPDYRNQLLWVSNFNLDQKEKTITFFTSDNSGDYEICLEGFTKDGNPISVKEIITVK